MRNTNRARRGRDRRGMSLLYMMVAFTALIGFASLGVDWARVQLVKTELQHAADAAALYAATGVASGAATVRQNAITAAGENTANGSSVVVTAADVTTGNWDASARAFTAAGTPSNAVQVIVQRSAARSTAVPLTVARMIPGTPGTVDVTARAIAYRPILLPPAGVVGLDWVEIQNHSRVDSYSSTNGPYTLGSSLANGDVASNGSIIVKNDAIVNGDFWRRSGQSITGSPAPPGQVLTFGGTLSYPLDTVPAGAIDLGIFEKDGKTSTNLGPGTFKASKFFVDNDHVINIIGSVTLYVTGDLKFSNRASTGANLPGDFQIRMTSSSHSVLLDNAGTMRAHIYAPGVPVAIDNYFDFCGSVIGKSLLIQNHAEVHYDQSVTTEVVGSIELVR